jgi:hypothetical protein
MTARHYCVVSTRPLRRGEVRKCECGKPQKGVIPSDHVKGYVLYRWFSSGRSRLYIGYSTVDLYDRTTKHAYEQRDKPWDERWLEFTEWGVVQKFGNLATLRAAEAHAIGTEHPIYNIRLRRPFYE